MKSKGKGFFQKQIFLFQSQARIVFIICIFVVVFFSSCSFSRYYGDYKKIYAVQRTQVLTKFPKKFSSGSNNKKILVLPFVDRGKNDIKITFPKPVAEYISVELVNHLSQEEGSNKKEFIFKQINPNHSYSIKKQIDKKNNADFIVWGNIYNFNLNLKPRRLHSIWSGKYSEYELEIEFEGKINVYFEDAKYIKDYKVEKSNTYDLTMCGVVKDFNNKILKESDSSALWCLKHSAFYR